MLRQQVLVNANDKKAWMIKRCNAILKRMNNKILKLQKIYKKAFKKGKIKPELIKKAEKLNGIMTSKVDKIMANYMKANGITKPNMIKKAKKLYMQKRTASKKKKPDSGS